MKVNKQIEIVRTAAVKTMKTLIYIVMLLVAFEVSQALQNADLKKFGSSKRSLLPYFQKVRVQQKKQHVKGAVKEAKRPGEPSRYMLFLRKVIDSINLKHTDFRPNMYGNKQQWHIKFG